MELLRTRTVLGQSLDGMVWEMLGGEPAKKHLAATGGDVGCSLDQHGGGATLLAGVPQICLAPFQRATPTPFPCPRVAGASCPIPLLSFLLLALSTTVLPVPFLICHVPHMTLVAYFHRLATPALDGTALQPLTRQTPWHLKPLNNQRHIVCKR